MLLFANYLIDKLRKISTIFSEISKAKHFTSLPGVLAFFLKVIFDILYM